VDDADLRDKVKVVFGPLPFNDQVFREMATYIAEEGITLVLVDTIHAWWGLSDENDASEVLRKGFPLLELIRKTQAAWLGLVHTRKSGGSHGEEIRGSSALVGLVDVAISMKRGEGDKHKRTLETVSRYSETPDKLIIEFDDHCYTALGDPDSVSRAARADKIWAALETGGSTQDDLSAATRLSRQDVSRGLGDLGGRIRKDGAGQKGDPYRYWRNSIHPGSNSEG
jgi:hypothetical protein